MPDFYAVAIGRVPGKYPTWVLCEPQVKGYTDARYKKFRTEAEADSFILQFGTPTSTSLVVAPVTVAAVAVAPVAVAAITVAAITVAKRARSATPPTS